MAGANVPKDPAARRRRNVPKRGEWQATPTWGWQHGAIPEPPDGLLESTRRAWLTWFRSWFAANWTVEDLPGLAQVAMLYDETVRGAKTAARAELRLWMDTYGMTPKGQQDRRWKRPETADEPAKVGKATPYAHLRVASGGKR